MGLNAKVEDFSLPDEEGREVRLSQFAGKPVILFFYPQAGAPGCTIEVCSFRDSYEELYRTGAVILGISSDTPQAQKLFKEKHKLPYRLLADVDEKVCRQFEVFKKKKVKLFGPFSRKVLRMERTTYLIGPDQRIFRVFSKVKPEGHAGEVLAALRMLEQAVK